MFGVDVEVWLQFDNGMLFGIVFVVIDLGIDFSYDYQDLYFICIGDCLQFVGCCVGVVCVVCRCSYGDCFVGV